MDEYGIEEARNTLGDLVNRAFYNGEAFTITRHGKSAAVLMNAEQYEEMRAALAKSEEPS